jgi:hypothetical protein
VSRILSREKPKSAWQGSAEVRERELVLDLPEGRLVLHLGAEGQRAAADHELPSRIELEPLSAHSLLTTLPRRPG